MLFLTCRRRSLLATGGALKPNKCFFHLISFAWKEDDSWFYENNENDEEFQAKVPLADGSFGNIQHLGINEPIKTLGSMTCPSGSSKGSIEYAKEGDGMERYDKGRQAQSPKRFVRDG